MRIVSKVALGMAATLAVAVIVVFTAFLWGMHSTSKRLKQEASVIIERFHRNYNLGDFRAMCTDLFGCTEDSRIEAHWREEVEGTRKNFGSYDDSTSSDIQAWVEPMGVRARFQSKFRSGDVNEQFDFMPLPDGRLKIAQFNVKEH